MLRPGGRFLLADVGRDGFTGWAARLFGRLAGSDEEFPPAATVAAMMAASGLHEVDVRQPLRGFRLMACRRR